MESPFPLDFRKRHYRKYKIYFCQNFHFEFVYLIVMDLYPFFHVVTIGEEKTTNIEDSWIDMKNKMRFNFDKIYTFPNYIYYV